MMQFMRSKDSDQWFPREIPYHALTMATNNFSEERFLGKGGFGPVYRGFLSEWKRDVAIKKLLHMSQYGMRQYESEVKIITEARHPNLVKLVGWCDNRGDLMLVYEFMPNGSLDTHLFKWRSLLKWSARYNIVLGLARALIYLHYECAPPVLHRDIKSSNVLLDSNFETKLADFGLAILFNHDTTSTRVSHLAGTRGYWAPEYAIAAKASKRSDVYSFGVVALEVACGKKALHTVMADEEEDEESDSMLLVEWVWNLFGRGRVLEAADERLDGDFVSQEMEWLLTVGLWCAHPNPRQRPTMRQALDALLHPETAQVPDLPAKMPPWTYPPVAMEMHVASSSFPPPPVLRSSQRHGPLTPPPGSRDGVVRYPEPSSQPSAKPKEPRRPFWARLAIWKKKKKEEISGVDHRLADAEFAYGNLLQATNGFSDEKVLRRDSFYVEYLGLLASGVNVSIKQFEGDKVVVNYMAVASRLSHRNLVKPIGWSRSPGGEYLVVFNHMVNGSLDQHLYGSAPHGASPGTTLPWTSRYSVAIDLASALRYLHDGSEKCVLHGDINSRNVLLDVNFTAKLDGFALARRTDYTTAVSTRMAGTFSYLAPEFLMTGRFTRESDVFSFGVIALEIACGRKPGSYPDGEDMTLLQWVWRCHGDGALVDAADPKLMGNFDRREMERLLVVGLWCSHFNPDQRPQMASVLRFLRFEEDPPVLSGPPPSVFSYPDEDFTSASFSDGIATPTGSPPLPI